MERIRDNSSKFLFPSFGPHRRVSGNVVTIVLAHQVLSQASLAADTILTSVVVKTAVAVNLVTENFPLDTPLTKWASTVLWLAALFSSLSLRNIWVQALTWFPTANHYFQTQSFQLQQGGFVGCWLSKLRWFSAWKLLLFAPELLSFSGRWPRPWGLRRKTTTRYPSLASKGSGHLLSRAVPHHRCTSEGVGNEFAWQTFRTQLSPTVCLCSGFFIVFLNRHLLDCPGSSRLSLRLKPMRLWASQLMVTLDDLQLEPGTEERGSYAFKQLWASVLANPVTNSVYYKAAMSLLPSRGPSPTGGCVRLGELFLKHVLSLLWSSSHMFPELQSPSLPSWFLPLRSPFLFSLLSLFLALLIKGAACVIWARAREPVSVVLGYSRGQNLLPS